MYFVKDEFHIAINIQKITRLVSRYKQDHCAYCVEVPHGKQIRFFCVFVCVLKFSRLPTGESIKLLDSALYFGERNDHLLDYLIVHENIVRKFGHHLMILRDLMTFLPS